MCVDVCACVCVCVVSCAVDVCACVLCVVWCVKIYVLCVFCVCGHVVCRRACVRVGEPWLVSAWKMKMIDRLFRYETSELRSVASSSIGANRHKHFGVGASGREVADLKM